MSDLKICDLYDLSHTEAAEYLKQFEYPWQALKGIGAFIEDYAKTLSDEYKEVKPGVFVHESAHVYESAFLTAPCIIGPETEVRHCAFIRGNAFVGKGCVVGNSTELKNVILFDKVQVPHYNYVGDSILGFKAHMGAGSITSNVKSDKTLVTVKTKKGPVETGLKKFGAMIGDETEVGCGSVLNPGTVLGKDCTVYPLSSVRQAVPSHSIFKDKDHIVIKKKKD